MAGHAHALRWWRTTCRLRHQLPRSQNFSSFPVSDASSSSSPPPLRDAFLSSCKSQTSTPRVLSTLQSNEPLGLSRRIGLAFSRDFSNEFDQAGGSLGMAPWFSGGFRHASTATSENSKPAEEVAEGITLTDNCIRRIHEIKREDGPEGDNKMLRLSVEGGGCSGFLYNFALDDRVNKDDRVFERDGAKLVVDDISFGFIKGATVDFTEELIRASFAVTINPNAASACGCGASFNAK